jgi:hypothetical protein
MIISKINGGLGNQLFQYAFGRRLAEHFKMPLKLDVSLFQVHKQRAYNLSPYPLQASIATKYEIKYIEKIRRHEWMNNISKVIKPGRWEFVYEPALSPYRPEILDSTAPNIYLDGYWQSEKYFVEISQLIRNEFSLQTPLGSYAQGFEEKIQKCNAVSLHVRRGDYSTDPLINRVHGLCSMDYYTRAIHYIREREPDIRIFVFSDDIEWARGNLPIERPVEFVSNSQKITEHEELYLISLCRRHIIANSSFSWWGAWLGKNIDKIVIAPEPWFEDKQIDDRDLIPENWVKLKK